MTPWPSLVAQLAKICLQRKRPQFDSWTGKIPCIRDRLPTPVYLAFPGGSDGEESTCNEGDLGCIPRWGRSPGGGHGNPLQYSCLERPMDRGVWQATVRGVKKSQTWPSHDAQHSTQWLHKNTEPSFDQSRYGIIT